MNKLVIFALLVVCGSILADTASICPTLQKSDCVANIACKFTETYKCINKCEALSFTDCILPINSSACENFSSCLSKLNCYDFTNQIACNQSQDICQWSYGSCNNIMSLAQCFINQDQASCDAKIGCLWKPKGCKNRVSTSCSSNDDQATCTNLSKFCTYAQGSGKCEAQAVSGNQGSSSNSGTPSNSNTPSTSSQILAVSLIIIIALI